MGIVIGGYSATIGEGSIGSGNITVINQTHRILKTGTINGFDIYSNYASDSYTAKLKIFRDNGATLDYITETSTFTVSPGLNSYSTSINIQKGDYIGFYIVTAGFSPNIQQPSGVLVWYKTGDVTTNDLKTSYSTSTAVLTIVVKDSTDSIIYTNILIGNDSNDGSTPKLPKLTLNAAITAVSTGGIVYVEFGDYSAQSSIILSKTMTFVPDSLGKETTGTVTLPPTA